MQSGDDREDREARERGGLIGPPAIISDIVVAADDHRHHPPGGEPYSPLGGPLIGRVR